MFTHIYLAHGNALHTCLKSSLKLHKIVTGIEQEQHCQGLLSPCKMVLRLVWKLHRLEQNTVPDEGYMCKESGSSHRGAKGTADHRRQAHKLEMQIE